MVTPWKRFDDLEPATSGWVSWFNEERLHSELDDLTPAEFEADYRHRSRPDAERENQTTESPSTQAGSLRGTRGTRGTRGLT